MLSVCPETTLWGGPIVAHQNRVQDLARGRERGAQSGYSHRPFRADATSWRGGAAVAGGGGRWRVVDVWRRTSPMVPEEEHAHINDVNEPNL